jgi:hypothetical protein
VRAEVYSHTSTLKVDIVESVKRANADESSHVSIHLSTKESFSRSPTVNPFHAHEAGDETDVSMKLSQV